MSWKWLKRIWGRLHHGLRMFKPQGNIRKAGPIPYGPCLSELEDKAIVASGTGWKKVEKWKVSLRAKRWKNETCWSEAMDLWGRFYVNYIWFNDNLHQSTRFLFILKLTKFSLPEESPEPTEPEPAKPLRRWRQIFAEGACLIAFIECWRQMTLWLFIDSC